MLTIHIDGREAKEVWDPLREEFVFLSELKPLELQLEHSLLSISKWESKYHKPFLSSSKRAKETRTKEEMTYYIQCMALTKVDSTVYSRLKQTDIDRIAEYISDPMSATTFSKMQEGGGRHANDVVTSELIYYWMVAYGIPFECQKWHLNRLMNLIKICGIKNSPSKKMSRRDVMAQNRSLNAARRAKYHSRG